ncbi:hypothetical protein QAD02_016681 [Eretmocerus hayati]|uniref:Uncharacterized protein n=1 Tax=Eretmocerus hayati TaxID=131215 RepID=A0ACC2PC85_9HYME|nr:hypothetical protein QAD02_016681 [Eretmocerus hayati]
MEDAGHAPRHSQKPSKQPMTKVSVPAAAAGLSLVGPRVDGHLHHQAAVVIAAATTLINRSGHCYQLHRPHLGLEPPSKRARAGTDDQEDRYQEQQHQQHLVDECLEVVDAPSAPAAGNLASKVLLLRHQQQLDSGGAGRQDALLHHRQRFRPLPQHHNHHPHHTQQQHRHNGHYNHNENSSIESNNQTHQQQQQQVCQRSGDTHVSSLYPEILALIFSNLDVRDRGRAAQVCVAWREASYHRSAWRGVEARLHLRKHSSAVFQCLERRGIRRVQVLSLTMRRGLGDVFRGVSKLQSLNLSGCYNMSDNGLNAALSQAFPALTELNLSLCKNITDASLGKIAHCLKNLETLHLGGCGNVSNTGLQLIAWGLRKLRRLDLRSCWNISDQGIAYLAGLHGEGNLDLEHLGLQDCQRLTDEGLRHISLGLANSLKSINLSFCVLITDSGMKHLAKIGSLCELDLRSCDNISEIGMAYLAEGGSRVSHLDVSFCDKIGDQALQHISQGLFNLKSLSLSACPISDEGICKIAKTQQELETLHIGQCSRLTDKSVFTIIESMPHLKCIDLYGCTRISKFGLDKIDQLRISLNLGLWQERR